MTSSTPSSPASPSPASPSPAPSGAPAPSAGPAPSGRRPAGAADWDARYAGTDLVWGAEPNRWVRAEVAGLSPGRALDLACGEGRNTLWLARGGWQVTAVDFSPVAIDKARRVEQSLPPTHPPVRWRCADATEYQADEPADLVLIAYLHLPAAARRQVLAGAVAALAPGGMLLVVGHDSTNLADGVGGPQDPAVLFTAADVAADLGELDPAIVVDRAAAVARPVDGADRPAVDALLRAHRPAG